jgi:hypothetical protein
MRIAHALAFALALSTVAVPSFAQSEADKNQARVYGQEGQAALDAKDYKTAEDKFKRAYALFPNAPTLALGLARALAANGKVVASEETYNKIIRDGAPPGNTVFQKAVDDSKAEIGPVSARVAHAVINVTGPDTSNVTLDGQRLQWAALGGKRAVDPGDHVVKASADGYKVAEQRFTVAEGKDAAVTITMEKDATASASPPAAGATPAPTTTTPGTPAPPAVDVGTKGGSSNKTFAFVAYGVGGVGLVVGAVTGLIAMGKHNDLSNNCKNGTCGPDQQSNVDGYHTMGTLSTVGFIVAGVGAVAGTVLLLTAPKDTTSTAFVSPYVGPGTVGATGRF